MSFPLSGKVTKRELYTDTINSAKDFWNLAPLEFYVFCVNIFSNTIITKLVLLHKQRHFKTKDPGANKAGRSQIDPHVCSVISFFFFLKLVNIPACQKSLLLYVVLVIGFYAIL